MLTGTQNKALQSVLLHYTGKEMQSITPFDDLIVFVTPAGESGRITRNFDGDMEIIIGDELVDIIEKRVYNLLITPDVGNSLEVYMKELRTLCADKISYRSKILIEQILKILELCVLNSDFIPAQSLEVKPFVIHNYKGEKLLYCLN